MTMSQRRVLVIDSDEARRADTARLIAQFHYRVIQADSGQAALDLIENVPPDIILCDADVLGTSVQELAEYVKEFVAEHIPFVVLVEGSLPERTEGSAASAVLSYPLEPSICEVLCELLLSQAVQQVRIRQLEEENQHLRKLMRQKSPQDPDTLFYRFDVFRHVILMEIKKAQRYGHPVSILLLAVDKFREISSWLNLAQRQSLFVQLGKVIVGSIRDIDIPLLFADDRILIAMPHTELKGAVVVADRIRERVEQIRAPESLTEIRITVSISVASTGSDPKVSFGRIVQQGMQGLKEAESKGGNMVVVHGAGASGLDGTMPGGGKLGPRTFFV